MPNKKCKAAVVAAEDYSDGRCNSEQLQAASEKVAVAILAVRSECAEYAATAARLVSSQNNVECTAETAAAAHGVKISLDDWSDEMRIEQMRQAMIVRDIVGNPFRSVAVDPAWRTETVVALAGGIYAERAFDRMPILADALEEAGCDSADILTHCRGDGPHVRGCWVVDLVLGKG
jgi:hypothetical protein